LPFGSTSVSIGLEFSVDEKQYLLVKVIQKIEVFAASIMLRSSDY
jgi:hypothetical protein